MNAHASATSKLAPLPPLSREEIAGVQELCAELSAHLEDVPHGKAKAMKRLLSEIRCTYEEHLPGGFFGHCEGCGTPLGNEDDFATSSEDCIHVCADCMPADAPTVTPEQEPVEA